MIFLNLFAPGGSFPPPGMIYCIQPVPEHGNLKLRENFT